MCVLEGFRFYKMCLYIKDRFFLESCAYPQTMIGNLLSDIKFTERESALLKHNNKEEKEMLPFVTQYQPLVSTSKEVKKKKNGILYKTKRYFAKF